MLVKLSTLCFLPLWPKSLFLTMRDTHFFGTWLVSQVLFFSFFLCSALGMYKTPSAHHAVNSPQAFTQTALCRQLLSQLQVGSMLPQKMALPGSQVLPRLFRPLRRVLPLAKQCLGRLWELVGTPQLEGGGRSKLAVGVLSHGAASTHMRVSPRSLRPHTVKSQASCSGAPQASQQLQEGRDSLSSLRSQ